MQTKLQHETSPKPEKVTLPYQTAGKLTALEPDPKDPPDTW